MTTSWPPLPDDPDSGAESHTVIASFPPAKRYAAAALLDLLPGQQVSTIVDPLDHTVIVGPLTAAELLVDLWHDAATPEQVIGMLARQRLIRPGLEAGHIIHRKDSTMTSTAPTTITFHAVVGQAHDPVAGCDYDGCRALAEFQVGCADDTGALVADVAVRVCPEHLAAQVREACDS